MNKRFVDDINTATQATTRLRYRDGQMAMDNTKIEEDNFRENSRRENHGTD